VKRIINITTAVLFLVGGIALGQERTRGFGTLDNMTSAEAKAKLASWLKEAGKSDAGTLQKLDAIWQESNRSMLDRVADSFALGDPLAAQLMAEARDPGAPAPIIVPDVFKSDKRPAFYRANLGLIYARALINRRVYEEALDTLKLFNADQMMDPAAYLFHRAVCEHAMQRKAEATKSIIRLLDEGSAISPERYKTVAALMLVDMVSWKDKDLGDIARKMENIERRLDIARGGPETHRQQREVLNRLDEMIKKLENQNKKKKDPGDGPPMPGDPKPGDGQDQCPDGGDKPGQGPPKGVNPSSSPATESANAGGSSNGEVDQAKFKKLVADWGRLPPAEQRRALQELVQGMPPRHREAIVNYFQNLTNPALNRR
jgi:polyhydroxyalkanoate synthesis regulator phasin